ncbi:MAG: hypothetical protein ACTSPY_02705 [Candidatus Helarchaeota archaeon]
MILITTSRSPSSRSRSLCNALRNVIPNSIRFNRGKSSINDLILKANELNVDLIIIIDSMYGNPSKIRFLKVTGMEGSFIPGEIYFQGIELNLNIIKRKYINNEYKIKILNVQNDSNIYNLGKFLAKVFNTDFYIISKNFYKSNKINYEEIFSNVNEKIICLVIHKVKDIINISFYLKKYGFIGPRLIIKKFINK